MNSNSSFSNTSALVTSFGAIVTTVLGLVFNILTVFVILKSSKLKSCCISPLTCGHAVSNITICFSLILVSIQFYQNAAFSEGSFLCYFSPIFYRYIVKIEYPIPSKTIRGFLFFFLLKIADYIRVRITFECGFHFFIFSEKVNVI